MSLSTPKACEGETMLVANMRTAPNKAAVASLKGLGLVIISMIVRANMDRVSATWSASPR
jgi:hypothetical protein